MAKVEGERQAILIMYRWDGGSVLILFKYCLGLNSSPIYIHLSQPAR